MDSVQIIIWLLAGILIAILSLTIVVVIALRRPEPDRGTAVLTDLMTKQVQIFGDTQQKLGELSTVGQQINQLSAMLKKTQQRGVWGEQILEVLLDNLLPNYHGPHTFGDGQKVEQTLRLPDGKIVAIDSKFVLDAYQRLEEATSDEIRKEAKTDLANSLKKRIDETAKYIRPTEGTLDFAMMFLPAEAVYYQLCSDDDFCIQDGARRGRKRIWDYALERHVIPVSPNTLYAYLTVIVYGLRGLQIEQKTKEILNHLLQVEVEFGKLQKEWSILGGHVHHAKSKYDDLDKTMQKFGDRLKIEAIPGLPAEDIQQLTSSPSNDRHP